MIRKSGHRFSDKIMLKPMSNASKNLLKFLGVSSLIMAAAVALNFVVDPLQVFRPARLFAAMYSQDSRLQDAGLIQSQDFDTVFMGTSRAIHFRQSDIDRILGVHSLKLSLNGSSSVEQNFVLAAALERRPKRVLWELDDWIFPDAPDIDSNAFVPANLYRRNAKGFAGYLFSGATARESAWILARSIPLIEKPVAWLTTGVIFKFPIANVDDINVLRPGFDVAGTYNAKKAMTAFRHITNPVRSAYLADGIDYDMRVRNFERDMAGLIVAHPDVTFEIYFPPYSILQWVAMRDASPGTFEQVYKFTAYVSRRLTSFPNVRLYDFRAVKDVTHDLNNYADVIHHSPTIDLKVLSWLAEGKYRVDASAPTASLDELRTQMQAYRVEGP
jgi:hypothetical protein